MIFQLIKDALSDSAELIVCQDKIDQYNANVECFDLSPLLVVKVSDTGDIKKLLNLANKPETLKESPFSIHVVSTGNNWGYGTRSPAVSRRDIVLLDLSALKDISFFDGDNGLVTVQPGVTQQQLYEFLQSKNSDFMAPLTGAGPNCSVLANAIERGYGINPIGDHFAAVTAINGFLPTGEYYQSPLAEMDETSPSFVDKSYKWKHGPYVEGLFTQSSNMVVTEVTISLSRLADGFDSFYLQFSGTDSFEKAYACTKMLFRELNGLLGSINLMDKRRVAAMVAKNPQGAGNHRNTSTEQLNKISKQYDLSDWTVIGTIYANRKISHAAKKVVRQIVKGQADRLMFSNSVIVKLGTWLTKNIDISMLNNYRVQLKSLSAGLDIMRGKPNQIALKLPYWRNPRVDPNTLDSLNPARDGCGLLWFAPLVPARAASMKLFINMVRTICEKHQIEPMITFTNLSANCADSTIPIIFDALNEEAKQAAFACAKELNESGLAHGFIPYRMNIKQQSQIDLNPVCWQAAKKIARALDPNAVLSPGIYALKEN